MGWSLEGKKNFEWPTEFLRTSHVKGNAKQEIEEVLDSLESAQKVWASIGNFPIPKAKAAKAMADLWAQDVKTFFDGAPFKKLLGSLKVCAKRVDTALKVKGLSSEAKKSLKSIETALQDHIDSVDDAVIAKQVVRIHAALLEADKEFTLKNLKMVFTSFRSCAAKKHPEIAEAANELKRWSDDPAVQKEIRLKVNGKIYDTCRDMTQNVQNLVKAYEYGGDLSGLEDRDVVTLPKLAKSLVPYANAKATFTDDMDVPDMVKLIRTIKVQADLFDQIATRVPH